MGTTTLRALRDRIRSLGTPEPSFERITVADKQKAAWLDYRAAGITAGDSGALLMLMARAPSSPTTGDEDYVIATHAWRALAQLQVVEAVPALVALCTMLPHGDEPYGGDFRYVCGLMGPAMVGALGAALRRTDLEDAVRSAMIEGLAAVATHHSIACADCVAILAEQLEAYPTQSELLNTRLGEALIDLGRREHRELLLRVFMQGYFLRAMGAGPADIDAAIDNAVYLRERGSLL